MKRCWLDRRGCRAGALTVVAGVALIACGGSGSSSGAQMLQLTARDFSFSPTTLNVDPGAQVTVTFKNNGPAEHSFTASAIGADVDADSGATKTATFTAPQSGTISFHCKYHPSKMQGQIVVGSGGGQAPSTTQTPAGGY
jgi:plastocyanin